MEKPPNARETIAMVVGIVVTIAAVSTILGATLWYK